MIVAENKECGGKGTHQLDLIFRWAVLQANRRHSGRSLQQIRNLSYILSFIFLSLANCFWNFIYMFYEETINLGVHVLIMHLRNRCCVLYRICKLPKLITIFELHRHYEQIQDEFRSIKVRKKNTMDVCLEGRFRDIIFSYII